MKPPDFILRDQIFIFLSVILRFTFVVLSEMSCNWIAINIGAHVPPYGSIVKNL